MAKLLLDDFDLKGRIFMYPMGKGGAMPFKLIFTALLLVVSVLSVSGYYLWEKPAYTNVLPESRETLSHSEVETSQVVSLALSEHKQRFIQTLLPLIEQENERILAVRAKLLLMTRKASLAEYDRVFLARLSEEYRVKDDGLDERQRVAALLLHVDVLPADLVLAQAAMESAWGASRFASEANNYFGQWCFKKGCGLVPKNRAEDKSHEVRRFASPAESVRAYMKNINSHPAYATLRELRHQRKVENQVASGEELAHGLKSYSQMGKSYVLAIRSIIKSNGLNQLASAI